MPATDLEQIVSLCKRRGFVYQSAEIYGGFRSTYDYGPLGSLLLRNVKEAWIRSMVQQRDDVVLIDAAILSPPQVWQASGHLANFTDPLVDCTECKQRFRLDKLDDPDVCPNCGSTGSFTEAREFNLMFKTQAGPVEGSGADAYLRPETAQGMFTNFGQRAADLAQEAAVRHRPGRQELPQRDHAPELDLPHPRVRADGAGVLRTSRDQLGMVRVLVQGPPRLVRRTRHPRRHAAAAPARRRRVVALLVGHLRRRVRFPVGLRRTRGHRPAVRLRPQAARRTLG